MDLSEVRATSSRRHPWETARVHALCKVLGGVALGVGTKILDVGAGDGFGGVRLFEALKAQSLTGFDIHLSHEQCAAFSDSARGLHYYNDPSQLEEKAYNLLLFLDVIEHVADDVAFLRDLTTRFARPGGIVLLTVPAFQQLFSRHDVELRHFRRYTRAQLVHAVSAAGLTPLGSGYLFGSLLLPRALRVLRERMLGAEGSAAVAGLGEWGGGPTLTRAIEVVLGADNRMLLGLSRLGVAWPGLSAWAVCRV